MELHYFSPQDRPQNDPRQAQDGSKRVFKAFLFHVDFCTRFLTVLDSILGPFGEPFGPQNRSQIEPHFVLKLHRGNVPQRDHFKRPQDRPKRPQDPPKGPQERPRRLPRTSKSPKGSPKSLPRASQEVSRGPKRHPRRLNPDQAFRLIH